MSATPPIEQKILEEGRKDRTLAHHECFGIAAFANAKSIEDYNQAKDMWRLLDEINRVEFTRQSTCHTDRLKTERGEIDLLIGTKGQIEAHVAVQPYRVYLTFVEFLSLAIFVIKENNRSHLSAWEMAEYYKEWLKLTYERKYDLVKVFLPAVPPLITDY